MEDSKGRFLHSYREGERLADREPIYNGCVKLVVCVVHNRDKGKVTEELIQAGFKFTVISTTGGFLREGNTTLLIGIQPDERSALMELIARNCMTREQVLSTLPVEAAPAGGAILASPVKVPVGGAVVFVLDVEQFERF